MKIIFVSLFSILLLLLQPNSVHAGERIYKLPFRGDSYIENLYPDGTHGLLDSLVLGRDVSGSAALNSIYIKYNPFDIEGIEDVTEENMRSVSLMLYQYKLLSVTDYYIKYGVWDLNWSENTLSWHTASNESSMTPYESVFSREIGWVDIDITEQFLEQVQDGVTEGTIVLKMKNPGILGAYFWSRECFKLKSVCHPAMIPHLRVVVMDDSIVGTVGEYNLYDFDVDFEYDEDNSPNEGEQEQNEDIDEIADEESEEETEEVIPEKSEEEGIVLPNVVSTVIQPVIENIQVENNIDLGRMVLGTSTGTENNRDIVCKYNYYVKSRKVVDTGCNLPIPNITSAITKLGNVGNRIEANITVSKTIKIEVNRVECLKPNILNPVTLIKCIEYVSSTERLSVPVKYTDIQLHVDGKWVDTFKKENKDGYTVSSNSYYKPKSLNITARYRASTSVKSKDGVWIDALGVSSHSKGFKMKEIKVAKPPYSFPHQKIVNVTQWHGKTAYNKNHTGIDFESSYIPVVAVSKGKIDYIGWDNSSGKCLSGGYYIKLKHSDGRYSTYLHLNSFAKGLKKGSSIKKGQVIGISGKSGHYNCEPLSAHLHFEVRNGSSQSTHTNPVPLIDTDWMKIKTARANIYPGRLTGNNPHPSF